MKPPPLVDRLGCEAINLQAFIAKALKEAEGRRDGESGSSAVRAQGLE